MAEGTNYSLSVSTASPCGHMAKSSFDSASTIQRNRTLEPQVLQVGCSRGSLFGDSKLELASQMLHLKHGLAQYQFEITPEKAACMKSLQRSRQMKGPKLNGQRK